jgi:oligopeptide transport system permease protein
MIAPITRKERAAVVEAAIKGRSLWDDALRRLMSNRAAVASLILLGVMLTIALLTFVLWPHDFSTIYKDRVSRPPTFENWHVFGTDEQGRDLFARVMVGFLVSLAVGVVASTVSLLIGVIWGATAGYVGGRTDQIMMRIVDVIYSLPYVFLVILLMAVTQEYTTGRPFMKLLLIFAAIGAIEWLTMSRIVRGQTLSLRRKEFVEAAQAAGASNAHIISRHIIPNVLSPVVVYLTLTIPVVILAESFLSFIGLGVQEPLTSLGSLIKTGSEAMEVAWWSLVFPAGVMTTTLMCFNFLGDGLRDAIDPRDR